MGDYSTTETLTRVLALERMKKLSEMIQQAKEAGDWAHVRLFEEERQNLKKQFMKAVK